MQMECECVSDTHQHESDGKGQLLNHDWLSGQGGTHAKGQRSAILLLPAARDWWHTLLRYVHVYTCTYMFLNER